MCYKSLKMQIKKLHSNVLTGMFTQLNLKFASFFTGGSVSDTRILNEIYIYEIWG